MAYLPVDPVELTRDLIRCPSVTPEDAGALEVLNAVLRRGGFETWFVDRGGIRNLFARWGEAGRVPCLGFNGHTDVVPAGNIADWRFDPFAAEIAEGELHGRGAADMKSGVAAFAAAALDFVAQTPPEGSVVLAITGDEEGDAVHGTKALLDWMAEKGERIDHCLVGEPTCPSRMGEMMKIGRRGSMTAYVKAKGVQGHSAYPHRARNPVEAMVAFLADLGAEPLDEGTEHFDASTLAVTGFDTGNSANNVIPAGCSAMVNIRFNDAHSSGNLIEWIATIAERVTGSTGVEFDVDYAVSGESFLTAPDAFSTLVADAVEAETGIRPAYSTSGGTSDARFITNHCPVVEFGLVGSTMHQIDERVAVEDIHKLKAIYHRILTGYFNQ